MTQPRRGRVGRQGRTRRQGRSVGQTRLREFEEQKGKFALENAQSGGASLARSTALYNQSVMEMIRHGKGFDAGEVVSKFGEEAVGEVLKGQLDIHSGAVRKPLPPLTRSMPGAGETRPDEFDPFLKDPETGERIRKPSIESQMEFESKVSQEVIRQRDPEFGSKSRGMLRESVYAGVAGLGKVGGYHWAHRDPKLIELPSGYYDPNIPGYPGPSPITAEDIEKSYEEGTPIRETYITSGERGDPEKLGDPKEGWELFRHRWMPWGRGSGVEGWADPDVWSGRKDRDLTKEEQAIKNIWNTAWTTWDVFSLTAGESLINVKNLVTGNLKDIKPATIIDPQYGDTWLERVKNAKKKFDEKPFWEQIAYSLADPFMMVGLTAKGLKLAAKIIPRMMVRAGYWKPSASMVLDLKIEEQEKMLKLLARNNVKAEVLPSASEITAFTNPRMQPKGRIGKAIVGWWDPSALISSMPAGAVRVTAQAAIDHSKTLDIADGYVQTMMAKVETKSRQDYGMSFNELFGTGPGQPKATKITQGVKQTDIHVNDVSDEALTLLDKAEQDPTFTSQWPGKTSTTPSRPGGPALRRTDTSEVRRIAAEHGIKLDYRTSFEDVINQLQEQHLRYVNQGIKKEVFDLDEAPMFGDVFQEYKAGRHVLNSDQLGMVKFVDEMLQEYLKMLQAEGINVKELGALEEAFAYFPRIVRDARLVGGKKVIDVSPHHGGARGSITKHRIHEFMDEQVLENGGVYGDPLDALKTYFRAGYSEIATQRRLNQIRPYAKDMLPNKEILEIAKTESDKVKGMQRSIRDMGHVVSGLMMTGPLTKSMKRLFPHLADDIDLVNALSPQEIDEITGEIAPRVLRAAGITRDEFNMALKESAERFARQGDRGVGYDDWHISHSIGREGVNRIVAAGQIGRGSKTVVNPIQQLVRKWVRGQASKDPDLQALGAGAAENKAYQKVLHDELRKKFGDTVTVYRGRRPDAPRPGTDRPGVYTNVSLKRSASKHYGEIEIDAIQIPVDEVVAMGNPGVSELIIRSGTILHEAAAAYDVNTGYRVYARSGARGTGGVQKVHVGDMILDDALGHLNVNVGSGKVLENNAKAAMDGTLKKNKNRILGAQKLRVQMNEVLEQQKITSALANREKRHAIEYSRGTGPTGGHVDALSKTLVFDRVEAAEMTKILEDNGNTVWKVGAEASGVLRKFRTVFDVGAPFIHGLPLLMSRPSAWAKATENHYRALFDPITGDKGLRAKYIAENSADIVDYLKHGGVMGSSEFTETMSEGGWFAALPVRIGESTHVPNPMKPALASIPSVINRSSGHFANSFETFLDAARIETWKGLRQSVDEKDAAELASFVNKMTGTSSSRALGVPLSQQQFEAALPFFAPRYFRSTSALMLDIFSGGLRGQQARKTITSMFAGVVLVHMATQQAMGQPIRLDPTNPAEFLRTDFMGQRVGFGSKPLSLVKAMAKIVRRSYEDPTAFLSWHLMEPSAYADNPILSTLRSQSAPVASNIFNVMTGADPLGREMPGFDDPAGILGLVTEQVSPFWLDAALEVALGSHAMSGSIVAGGTEFGGAVSFPIPTYDLYFEELAKKAEEKWPNRGDWEQIKKDSETNGRVETEQLLVEFPQLRELLWKSRKSNERRVSKQKQTEYYKQKEAISQEWYHLANQAGENFEGKNGVAPSPDAGQALRTALKTANRIKRSKTRELEARYPEIIEAMDEKTMGLAEDYPLLSAQSEYYDRLSRYTNEGGVLDPNTEEVDYSEMHTLKLDIAAKYGDEALGKINDMQKAGRVVLYTSDGQKTTLNSTIVEYYDSMEILEPYWNAYKTVVPPDQWDAWKKFDEAPRDVQAALFKHPDFAEWFLGNLYAQHKMLRDDPSVDMALVKFFGRTSKNKQNWEAGMKALLEAEDTLVRP